MESVTGDQVALRTPAGSQEHGVKVVEHIGEARPAPIAAQSVRRSRPLLLLERTMYREGRTPFTSVFPIQVLGELDEERLRQALARVQAKHPLLRCVVEETSGGSRFVLLDRPAPIPMRILERCGEDHWQAEVRREWVAPFDATREPLVRVVWLRAGDGDGDGNIRINELLLIGHHCICDGHSGINLVRECLSAYDRPEQDLGVYDALGTVEDIVPAALLEDARFQRRVRRKAGILRLTLFLKQLGARKSPGPRIAAEQMYFHRWSIGNEAALALTERCRSENVTVLAALGVAFMQAFRDVRGVKGLRKTRTMVNARRFLPEMHADAMLGLAPGVTLRTKGLPRPREMSAGGFWDRARAIKADMTSRIKGLGAGLYETLASLERLHDKYSGVVAYFDSAPAVRNVTISNLGRLDLPQQYRTIRLEKVYSPLVMVSPTPANTVVVSSFAGEMEFAIVSDEHSLPHAQALEISRRAMEIVAACVAIRTETT
jgi:hypothetical protein